jgi:peptidyl-tRNA hydrolase
MRIKILVRKNLKMTEFKTAAQCVHAALNLYKLFPRDHWSCVVLGVSDKKFDEKRDALMSTVEQGEVSEAFYVVTDAGYTEVPPGTETCLAFYEEDPRSPDDKP